MENKTNKTIKIFSDEFKKFELGALYIKVTCPECGNSWGVSVINNEELPAKMLICRECASRKILNEPK